MEDWKQEQHAMEFQYMLDGPDTNFTIHFTTGDLTLGLSFSTKDHNDGTGPSAQNCAHDYTGTELTTSGGYIQTMGLDYRARGAQELLPQRRDVLQNNAVTSDEGEHTEVPVSY